MKKSTFSYLVGIIAFFLAISPAISFAQGKITICHYPPGNPENVQTIRISRNAWPAHQAHGDSMGECNANDDDNDHGGGHDGNHDNDHHHDGNCDHGNDGDHHHDGDCEHDGEGHHHDGNCEHEDDDQCMSTVSATFSSDNISVTATSNKDLSNVVLKFCDDSTQKFDDLNGNSQTFSGTGDAENKEIVGIWIKSGCNQSGDGPGYGEYVSNSDYNGFCTSEYCQPSGITGGSISFNSPYDPAGTNIITNVELPSSPFDGVEFEYIWLQSLENVPNTEGNSSWNMIDGSEGLTDLQISGLTQTTYYIRCARIQGCETYWGETNIVEVEVDPCTPENIDGGAIAFNGPYDPDGTNIITNVELPSSPFDGVDFEYVWVKSLVNEPNYIGNSNWSLVEGSQNLTELPVSGLLQTTYFIRCARIIGCDSYYWGETNIVEVEVDPCTPENIDGGAIAFNGPYDPDGTNIITNVEFPSSPFDGVDFEYVWVQSLVNEPNYIGNSNWSLVEGSQNLTELPVSGLLQTTYFIRCARIIGCDSYYWGETNIVEVEVEIYEAPTASLSGGGFVCPGESTPLNINLTGEGPYTLVYNNGTEDIEVLISADEYVIDAQAGIYTLISVEDSHLVGTVEGEAIVEEFTIPTAVISGGGTVCNDGTSPVSIELSGTAPFIINYTDGVENTEVQVEDYNYSFEASVGNYSLISISDSNCQGTVSGNANVTQATSPTAEISGSASICANEVGLITINLTGEGPWDVIYSNGVSNTEVSTDNPVLTFEAGPGTYSLVSVSNDNCQGSVGGEAIIEVSDSPTASISTNGPVCDGELATIVIELTGIGPWDVIYSDGVNNTKITTSSSVYSFESTSGTYSLISVTDQACSGTVSGLATVETYDAPTATISGGGPICNKDLAQITIEFTGTGPWNYTYKQGKNNISGSSENSLLVINTSTLGQYSMISVSDANCQGTVSGSAYVTTYTNPNGGIYLNETAYCVGQEVVLNNDINGEGLTYNWTTTGSGNLINADSKLASYVSVEDESNVTFTVNVDNGCTITPFSANANFISALAKFTINPESKDGDFLVGVEYNFVAEDNDATTYSWDFGDGTGSSQASIMHAYSSVGKYTVSLTVTNQGCSETNEYEISVVDNKNLYIPNVFSPTSANPDNNSIKIYGEDLSTDGFEFFIYNRWGQVVYKTSNLDEAQEYGWNGETRGEEKGNNVFTYTVRGKYNDGKPFEETGTITLVK